MFFRINRNILECKDIRCDFRSVYCQRINRNILECKDEKTADCRTYIIVLIETYWNVKFFRRPLFRRNRDRINRNILECKVSSFDFHRWLLAVLIETYWNVKAERTGLSPAF